MAGDENPNSKHKESDGRKSPHQDGSSNATGGGQPPVSAVEIELICLKNKRTVYGLEIEDCHTLGQTALTAKKSIPEFLFRFSIADKALKNLEDTIMACFALEIKLNPAAKFDDYNELLRHFKDMYCKCGEIKMKLTTPEPAAESSNASTLMNTTTFISSNAPTLPRIDLQKFDGTISAWPEYRANFESVIHKHELLTPSAKLNYLRRTLTGPPLALIKELPITDANYPIAWEALTDMYENKRMIGASLLNKLLNFPLIKEESKSDLSKFMSTFGECVAELKTLEIADLGDFMTLHIALKCLPKSLVKTFERRQTRENVPTTKDLLKFVQRQIEILDLTVDSSKSASPSEAPKRPGYNSSQKRALATTTHSPAGTFLCMCDQNHAPYKCQKFLDASVEQRDGFIRKNRLCATCFRDHPDGQCSSVIDCRICRQRHNTLLHRDGAARTNTAKTKRKNRPKLDDSSSSKQQQESETSGSTSDDTKRVHQALTSNPLETALLGTALVLVRGANGRFQKVRAMIDSGSMTTIIRDDCARRLGLPREETSERIVGMADQRVPGLSATTLCIIKPIKAGKPVLRSKAYILKEVTAPLPSGRVPDYVRKNYRHLPLADPKFYEPQEVQLLIGADLYPYVFTGEKEVFSTQEPVALHSIFGWILTGACPMITHNATASFPVTKRSHLTTLSPPPDDLIRRFWEIEEPPSVKCSDPADLAAEKIFSEGHYRDETGRYVVPLPFKEPNPDLGESLHLATKRLLNLERRFQRDHELQKAYTEFMREYEELGHKTLVDSKAPKGKYFIPHHGVWKLNSSTTKMRTVFDASMKTTSGKSLNDVLLSGPKLQKDITEVLTAFRFEPVAFVADICKMYRQFNIVPEHRAYQHILWREKPTDPIKAYRLNTVTYGETPSSFLSIRAMHQLSVDEGSDFPEAAQAMRDQLYVDDFLVTAPTIPKGVKLRRDLTTVAGRGGLELKKFHSNFPEVLEGVPEQDREALVNLNDAESILSLLGIHWNPVNDTFAYNLCETPLIFTKRAILSTMARIYDPLGWISPVVFWIKCLMQRIWLSGTDWDEPVTPIIKEEWSKFFVELPKILKIRLPRFISFPSENLQFSLVGFCDASAMGYSACVYSRVQTQEGEVKTNLLISKTKVAPLKTLSIPRLELCGATLIAKLLRSSADLCRSKVNITHFYAFSDATTVLTWIKTPPHMLKTYVANRVVQILDNLPPESWRYVNTKENPADIASRSCTAAELGENQFWWHDPQWLKLPPSQWPNLKADQSDSGAVLAELKPTPVPVALHQVTSKNGLYELIHPTPHPRAVVTAPIPISIFKLPVMTPPPRFVQEPGTPPRCSTPPPSEGLEVVSPQSVASSTFSDEEEDFLPFSKHSDFIITSEEGSETKRRQRYQISQQRASLLGRRLTHAPLENARQRRNRERAKRHQLKQL